MKNFTLQKIELPNESDEMIAKESGIVHALEKLVKNWTDSITKAQDQLTNYPKNITSAMMEIDNRKRAVSNWSILAQQLKSDNIKRIKIVITNAVRVIPFSLLKKFSFKFISYILSFVYIITLSNTNCSCILFNACFIFFALTSPIPSTSSNSGISAAIIC